jgi:hypothetical protein
METIIPSSIVLFEGSHDLPACPSNKSRQNEEEDE